MATDHRRMPYQCDPLMKANSLRLSLGRYGLCLVFYWLFKESGPFDLYLAIFDKNYDAILNVDFSTLECRLSFGAENRTQKSTYFEQRCKLREYFSTC